MGISKARYNAIKDACERRFLCDLVTQDVRTKCRKLLGGNYYTSLYPLAKDDVIVLRDHIKIFDGRIGTEHLTQLERQVIYNDVRHANFQFLMMTKRGKKYSALIEVAYGMKTSMGVGAETTVALGGFQGSDDDSDGMPGRERETDGRASKKARYEESDDDAEEKDNYRYNSTPRDNNDNRKNSGNSKHRNNNHRKNNGGSKDAPKCGKCHLFHWSTSCPKKKVTKK
jgi:hypothetical protein